MFKARDLAAQSPKNLILSIAKRGSTFRSHYAYSPPTDLDRGQSAAHAHLEDGNLAAEVAHAIDCDRAEPGRLGADPCELETVSCDRLQRVKVRVRVG